MKILNATWALTLLGLLSCRETAGAKAAKIALLLPESKTARYESQDLPIFKARLVERGFAVQNLIYANANQDVAAQRQQLEAALTNGATVVVMDPVDSVAAGPLVDLAHARGAAVLAYDRLIHNTEHLAGYISFDNEKVGALQGQALLDALKGKVQPQVVLIHGSPTDANAALFKRGAHAVLDGKVTVAREYDTPDWSPDKAQNQMQQALTALGNKVDGVYAANDGTAGGALAALRGAGLWPPPPVTGQDAELAAIQRLVAGEQAMTIYKAIRAEAQAAADVALALFNKQPTATLLPTAMPHGKGTVPSLLLEPRVVTAANIKDTIIKDAFWTVEQVCTAPYQEACTALGLLSH